MGIQKDLIEKLDERTKMALDYFKSKKCDLYFDVEKGVYIRSYYFNNKKVITPLTGDFSTYLNYYIDQFLPIWGVNDWTLQFLKDLSSLPSLKGLNVTTYIFTEIINVQVYTKKDLEILRKQNSIRLAKVKPSVNLNITEIDKSKLFQTEDEIALMKTGKKIRNLTKLTAIASKYIDESNDVFVSIELAKQILQIETLFKKNSFKNMFRVSSGVRSILTQRLFRELGYPAVELSNHNLGLAFDLALSNTKVKPRNFNNNFTYYLKKFNTKQKSIYDKIIKTNKEISFAEIYKIYIGKYNSTDKAFSKSTIKKINQLALKGTSISGLIDKMRC